MIKSMTGFGKAVCELPNKKIHVEIKSLNSKQLDLNTRIPAIYREKELELRNEIAAKLQRGKVDLVIITENLVPDKLAQLNIPVIENYYAQLNNITNRLSIGGQTDYIRAILSMPDTLKSEQAELNEDEWKEVKRAILIAVSSIDQFRIQEGATMESDISDRARTIESLLEEITPFEQQRLERIKTRIRENLQEIVDKNRIDENRFEQELIYYIEKLDVSEERVRLKNHIDYFLETMKENEPVGKKMAFITQEMGREINTLGSKANDADIQKIVIRMKDELEKIKELSLNIL